MPRNSAFLQSALTGWAICRQADVFEPLAPVAHNVLAACTQSRHRAVKPGVAVAQADAEMKLIAHRLGAEYPEFERPDGELVSPLASRWWAKSAALRVFTAR